MNINSITLSKLAKASETFYAINGEAIELALTNLNQNMSTPSNLPLNWSEEAWRVHITSPLTRVCNPRKAAPTLANGENVVEDKVKDMGKEDAKNTVDMLAEASLNILVK